MARPTTKEQLIRSGETNFDKLFVLIDSMTPQAQQKPFASEGRDRNIRDVLVHLYEWHLLLLNWAQSNRTGTPVGFLPEPYTWKTYPAMNVGFWEKHQKTSLERAFALARESHGEVMKLIASFSDEQLFTKKYFPWTGTTSLGSYCVSATSSHYDWAMKKIKDHRKSCE